MPISFNNLHLQIVPLEDFPLQWRFTDEKYDRLPDIHLEQLQPLNKEASNFVWNFTTSSGLTAALPFKKDFFKTIDQLKMELHDEKDIKKWLYHRGLPFEKKVILSWQPNEAMKIPWKILIKYYNSFFYPASDDLLVFDPSLNWALLFYHEEEIYFGTNEKFVKEEVDGEDVFIW